MRGGRPSNTRLPRGLTKVSMDEYDAAMMAACNRASQATRTPVGDFD